LLDPRFRREIARCGTERVEKSVSRLARHPEIFSDAELAENAFDLQRALDSEPADLVRLEAGNVVAEKEDAAAVGGKQSRHEIEEGGLAGAVWADDRLGPPTR